MHAKKPACPTYPHLLHGADYNPEQWIFDKSVWDADMRLMQLANCNEMTVGIFSWAKLEPREGEYDFTFLDEIIEKIGQNGGKVILSTPSAARPHWLSDQYPEVLRVGPDGVREHFRARHNHCYTSPVYREKVRAINTRLAQRYGNNPTVIAWHISNEYGGECRCPLCAEAFRNYLREKFHHDIQALNMAYWTTFWSHTYDSFDQIEPPGKYTEADLHGLNLDWHRFVTHQTRDFILQEIAPIREYAPHLPVTINMMYEFYDLDYHQIADVIDIASWDSYPEWHHGDDAEIAQRAAFWHDLYRSLKKRPFLLMESTPSLVNWKPYNKPKRPGMDVLSSIQAVAHGSDSVQYFQWRKSRGSSEKFHGAVVGHDGTENTRVFRSVQTTGQILKTIDEVAGTITASQVALIFDWENMWALDNCQGYANAGKKYLETCYAYHKVFWERGINCDIISPKADLSGYTAVIAPMLYLTDAETTQNLSSFVEAGGVLYGTYMLGTVDENDLCHLGGIPGQSLKDVFGILAEEIDTLYPEERQHAAMGGRVHELVDYCEVIHPTSAETLAHYADGYYQGMSAVTVNSWGKGKAYYQACRDSGTLKEQVLEQVIREHNIRSVLETTPPLPHGVTAHSRTDGENTYIFLENYSGTETHTVPLPQPMLDLLTDTVTDTCQLSPYGFCIFKTN
jgi:beta-galactosidase